MKLRVEIRFKTFYLFLEFFCTDSVLNILLTRMVLLEIFAYPSNERVILRTGTESLKLVLIMESMHFLITCLDIAVR